MIMIMDNDLLYEYNGNFQRFHNLYYIIIIVIGDHSKYYSNNSLGLYTVFIFFIIIIIFFYVISYFIRLSRLEDRGPRRSGDRTNRKTTCLEPCPGPIEY
jgi:hypothetical protein